jgi:uncharacterized protein YdiU (UPF0061 family)
MQAALDTYRATFESTWRGMLAAKLGLDALDREGDDALLEELFAMLQAVETDVTLFYRGLASVPLAECADRSRADARLIEPLRPAFYADSRVDGAHVARLAAWLRRLAERVRAQGDSAEHRIARMNATNPKYVPRNYLAQQAIDAATRGDTSVLERLMRVLSRPYDEQPGDEDLAQRRPEWARDRPGCSALSCSS